MDAPGWYGKLPSVGDFATRRWPDALLEPWDQWLASGLAAMRERDPDGWLQGYLQSPTWRFLLAPGALGTAQSHALAGVLMPSVDRVGRYFPLSIAAELRRLPHTPDEMQALLTWQHQLDDLAADVLQDDWSIDELEGALATLHTPDWRDAGPSFSDAIDLARAEPTQLVPLALPGSRLELVSAMGQGLLRAAVEGSPVHGLAWWACEPAADPTLRRHWLSQGLPQGSAFHRLFAPVDADVPHTAALNPSSAV